MHFPFPVSPLPVPRRSSQAASSTLSTVGSSYCSHSLVLTGLYRWVPDEPMCACVHATGAGVLLIQFTSAYQKYKGNERPAWCAISELRQVRCTARTRSFSLSLFLSFFLEREEKGRGRLGKAVLSKCFLCESLSRLHIGGHRC